LTDVAVIGARPASPWLWGPLRPRPRVRQRPRRRSGTTLRRLGAGRRIRQRLDVRATLIAIVAAAGLAFFYLSQSSHVAATGYEIDSLEAELAALVAEQQQLLLQVGHARSPAEITRRAREELHLVPLEDASIQFVTPPSDTDD
jgi:cell division protein FtsB